MDNVAGTPVEGENFHGREADIARLITVLENDDVLLLGPRRIGKTSIARAVMAVLQKKDWHTLEVNVAACQNEAQFIEKLEAKLTPLMASFAQKTQGALGDAWLSLAGRIQKLKLSIGAANIELGLGNNAPPEDWTKLASDCLGLIAKVDGRWLIYVDELPIMLFNILKADPVGGVSRVRRFLDWFRNDVRAMPEVKNLRWLVSGSVGLDTLVQQHGMADTINSFRHEGLAAFTDLVAIAMLRKLAVRYNLPIDDSDAQRLIDAVMWAQPYYLQLAFNHLLGEHYQQPNGSMTILIERAVAGMSTVDKDNDFHHWEKRLEIQLSSADAAHCTVLLDMASQSKEGIRPETLLAKLQERLPSATTEEATRIFVRLRDILQRDAYWTASENAIGKRYHFRLEPLRQWWQRRNTL